MNRISSLIEPFEHLLVYLIVKILILEFLYKSLTLLFESWINRADKVIWIALELLKAVSG
jgi:hypothetical protein